jgi:hypothetical protein
MHKHGWIRGCARGVMPQAPPPPPRAALCTHEHPVLPPPDDATYATYMLQQLWHSDNIFVVVLSAYMSSRPHSLHHLSCCQLLLSWLSQVCHYGPSATGL